MIESILTSLFVASRISIALTSFGLIVGSAVHDWRAINWQRRQKRHPKTALMKNRPLVSVVILSNGSVPTQSIESAVKTTYRNLEILLLYRKDKLQKQSRTHPRRTVKQLALPSTRNEKKSWAARLRRVIKGELVLVIDSNTRLYPRTIHEIVSYFALNQRVEAVKLGTEVEPRQSLFNLVKEYEQTLLASVHKTLDVIGANNTDNLPTVWRRRAFLARIKPPTKIKTQKPGKVGYISNPRILANSYASVFDKQTSASEQLFKTDERALKQKAKWGDLLQNWYVVLLLLEPLILGYSIYVFIAYKVSILLVVSWLITVASFSFFVWGDEQLKVTRRLRLTLLLPLLLSLIYVMAFIKVSHLEVKISKLSARNNAKDRWKLFYLGR